jgi:uncharacterized delta-60 repeat protein
MFAFWSRLRRRMPIETRKFRPRCDALEERLAPAAGQLDPTFGNGGFVTTNVRFQPADEIALPDGKYLAAGTTESLYFTDFVVARFNADGSLDTTFGKAGYSGLDFDNSSDNVSDLVRQADGKILVVGSSSKTVGNLYKQEYAVARFNADGSVDTTFGNSGKVTLDLDSGSNEYDQLRTAIVQADGKIVLVGLASQAGAISQITLVRLNPDGSRDVGFGNNGSARLGPAYAVAAAAQPLRDGRMLFVSTNSNIDAPTSMLIMVRANGTLDTTFGNSGLVPLSGINPNTIAIQSDGKILLAGGLSGFIFRSPDFVVERLNADGSIDNSFGVNGRVVTDFHQNSDTANAIAVQPDGKILVGGSSQDNSYVYPPIPLGHPVAQPNFIIPHANDDFALVRYNSDGTLDKSFGMEGRVVTQSGGSINKLIVQADGKILAIGPQQQVYYYGSSFLNGGLIFARYDGTGARTHYFATGADAGGGPHVKVYGAATGQLKFSFLAFDSKFTGGVRVATGDVNGDGVDDIICAAGPGGGPDVRVYDGTNGRLLTEFFAYDRSFAGGVFVAAGDVTGDGKADIITGAGAGGGPDVKVFDGIFGYQEDEFMAYDQSFHGGVSVAAGDVNNDGVADIITGAGPGGGPHVEAFDGKSPGNVINFYPLIKQPRALLFSTMAFAGNYTGGVFVAAGDVNGDGHAEIFVGQDASLFNARVREFDGATGQQIADFAPLSSNGPAQTRVATADLDGDGKLDLIVGSGPNVASTVKTFKGTTLSSLNQFQPYDPSFLGGVFVG